MSTRRFQSLRNSFGILVALWPVAWLAPSLSAQPTGPRVSTDAAENLSAALAETVMITTTTSPGRHVEQRNGNGQISIRSLPLPDRYRDDFDRESETAQPIFASLKLSDTEPLDWGPGTGAQSTDQATTPPPPKPAPPSLKDLGFSPDQLKGNAEEQARLNKRSHMLQIHQRLGLITLIPMLATIITSGNAGGKHGTSAGRNLHGALGIVTAGMYFTAASFAIRAPKISGTPVRGPIRLHKALAWVHGIGMILTPILGAMARSQLDHGEKVHGIAAAHSVVADITYAAYAVAIGAVAIKF
jgi:hypothetical protein